MQNDNMRFFKMSKSIFMKSNYFIIQEPQIPDGPYKGKMHRPPVVTISLGSYLCKNEEISGTYWSNECTYDQYHYLVSVRPSVDVQCDALRAKGIVEVKLNQSTAQARFLHENESSMYSTKETLVVYKADEGPLTEESIAYYDDEEMKLPFKLVDMIEITAENLYFYQRKQYLNVVIGDYVSVTTELNRRKLGSFSLTYQFPLTTEAFLKADSTLKALLENKILEVQELNYLRSLVVTPVKSFSGLATLYEHAPLDPLSLPVVVNEMRPDEDMPAFTL